MPNLQYITRDHDSPQGKQRIYFCCHANDTALYLKKIAQDVWKHVNAVIYYAEENYFSAEDFDETQHLSMLKEMQLILIPVTQKLLLTNNYAMDTEIPFVIKQNRRILPTLQEPGLDMIFGKKFGSVQYLDAFQSDLTAIPYEVKFERFLKSILLADDLTEKVRAAFDAYVFLSYRKKDRHHAQELMQLIHSNDFCRDIAIWYDEFLVPGENFNDAIANAIHKCDLFALTITPNLVIENNYIQEHEYPEAIKIKKKILPVEMVHTSKEALMANYQNIPDPVDAHNPEALTNALLENLSHIAKMTHADDPQHNFFVGLAYLNGIDVEENFSRGYALIHSAAEAGLVEAMEQLVLIHNNESLSDELMSIATSAMTELEDYILTNEAETPADELFYDYISNARNALKAEKKLWPEKIVAYWEAAYQKDQTFFTGQTYAAKLIALAESCFEHYTLSQKSDLDALEESRAAYKKALRICEALPKPEQMDTIFWEPIICMFYLGHLHASENDIPGAFQWYRQAETILAHLYETTDDPIAIRRYGAVQYRLGNLYLNQRKTDEARSCYTLLLEIAKELYRKHNTFTSKELLARAHMNLARTFSQDSDRKKALYEEALKLREDLVLEVNSIDSKIKAIDTHQKLAAFCNRTQDPTSQFKHLESAMRYSTSLMQDFGSTNDTDLIVSVLDHIYRSYLEYGSICTAHGRVQDALDCYQAYADFIARSQVPSETKIYIQAGDLCYDIGNYEKAEEFYTYDIEIYTDVSMIEKAHRYGVKLSSRSLLQWGKNLALQAISECMQNDETSFTFTGNLDTYQNYLAQIESALHNLS